MNFGESISTVLKNYSNFNGRARRSEFWWFYLFGVLLGIVANLVDRGIGFPILSIIVGLGLIVPELAVGCRRLHDTGRSGWLQLIAIIPIVGIIVLIVFWAQDGHQGSNQHGPSPKYAAAGY